MTTYPIHLPGVYRTYDAPHPLGEAPRLDTAAAASSTRTDDTHPLGTFLHDEAESETKLDNPAAATGHRETDGVCGCSACTKRRVQDSPIRSLRDINKRNRQLHRRP